MKPYNLNRWQIEGTLTTRTNLHIGSGETIKKYLTNKKNKESVEIEAVVTDCKEKPYLTGSAIKGNIRSWLESFYIQSNNANNILERLFGTWNPDNFEAIAGNAEFCNAYYIGNEFKISESEIEPDEIKTYFFPPYWDQKRLTGITTSAAIDRQKKVASDNMLAHWEFVPHGMSFKLIISGKNAEENDIPYLLLALNKFNNSDITLGANTVNGWGQFKWEPNEIKGVSQEQILEWIKSKNKSVGYNLLLSLTPTEIEKYKKVAEQIGASIIPFTDSPRLTLGITLTFDSPFLVNDPAQTGKGENFPDHAPLLDNNGNPFLPSKSIRGAFRSQAEKILRTIKKDSCCYPTQKSSSCKPVLKKSDIDDNLCMACKLFGASGWQSPIEFSNFTYSNEYKKNEKILKQEFVAIDRFTGGGAKSNKFNASSVYKPILEGTLSIDLTKLETAGISDWALGLIALTLRDLVEGDITLGFGAAKGYGNLNASITSINLTGTKKILHWNSLLSKFKVSEEFVNTYNFETPLPETLIKIVEELVTNFVSSKELKEVSNAKIL